MSSDWSSVIKPAARKVFADLQKTHGEQTGAVVEALEIARRRAEINQTEEGWRERHGFDWNPKLDGYSVGVDLLVAAGGIFSSLCEEFGPQRATHVLNGIGREYRRFKRGNSAGGGINL